MRSGDPWVQIDAMNIEKEPEYRSEHSDKAQPYVSPRLCLAPNSSAKNDTTVLPLGWGNSVPKEWLPNIAPEISPLPLSGSFAEIQSLPEERMLDDACNPRMDVPWFIYSSPNPSSQALVVSSGRREGWCRPLDLFLRAKEKGLGIWGVGSRNDGCAWADSCVAISWRGSINGTTWLVLCRSLGDVVCLMMFV
jgi:hypothetical protein